MFDKILYEVENNDHPATTVVQPASFDQPILNIPHPTSVYDALIHNNLDCLGPKF
jgi:hypothetical protein